MKQTLMAGRDLTSWNIPMTVGGLVAPVTEAQRNWNIKCKVSSNIK
jgi:hypothetical protein